jgi:hypothetical protein
VLGFADLRGYLQARTDAGLSIPRLSTELGVREWSVKRALTQAGVTCHRVLSGWSASAATPPQQRLTARAAELGFTDITAYLTDLLLARGWRLADVTVEFGAPRVTVWRLMDQYGIRRTRRSPPEQAAGERGRRAQAAAWQAPHRSAGRAN